MSDYISQTITVSSCQSVRHQQSVSDKGTTHYRCGRKELPGACRLEKTALGGGGGAVVWTPSSPPTSTGAEVLSGTLPPWGGGASGCVGCPPPTQPPSSAVGPLRAHTTPDVSHATAAGCLRGDPVAPPGPARAARAPAQPPARDALERGGGGPRPPPLQGAPPMPSHCTPDGRGHLQWHLQPRVTAHNRFGNLLPPPNHLWGCL